MAGKQTETFPRPANPQTILDFRLRGRFWILDWKSHFVSLVVLRSDNYSRSSILDPIRPTHHSITPSLHSFTLVFPNGAGQHRRHIFTDSSTNAVLGSCLSGLVAQ